MKSLDETPNINLIGIIPAKSFYLLEKTSGTMNKEALIQLINNIYRLTLLFPKKEPLRYKMRELADDILAGFISFNFDKNPSSKNPRTIEEINRNLEILDNFFEVAKNQNWVSQQELLNLKEEYSKLNEALKSFKKPVQIAEKPEVAVMATESVFRSANNVRQLKILEILKQRDKIQVWEVKQVFPEVTKRTLRRDFEQMLNQGLIVRMGERNETFYQINPQTA